MAIDPAATSIGAFLRHPSRIGRMVTQEEAAEALAITRVWYSHLEHGMVNSISRDLAHRIAETFGIHRLALMTRQVNRELRAEMLEVFTPLRELTKRLSSASSYAEAVRYGVETLERILQPDCVVLAALQPAHCHETPGCAAGARAHTWTPLSNDMVIEANTAALRDGGISIASRLPLVEELPPTPTVSLTVDRPHTDDSYDYECTFEKWRSFNGELQVRSAAITSLFDCDSFAGVLGACWLEPNRPDDASVLVTETVAGIVRLASVAREV